MADNLKARSRALRRCHEGGRLEEELWCLAYERVWPLIRGSPRRSGKSKKTRGAANIPLARRA